MSSRIYSSINCGRIIVGLGVCLFLSSLPVLALGISGQGTTAATFLKLSIGPRAVAMGESFVAVADDVSAVNWNPAGLAQIKSWEVTAMHAFWFQDIFLDHIGAAMPVGLGVAGASLVFLNQGTLLRSEAGDSPDSPDRGSFSASDTAFTGAYSLMVASSMSVGGGLKLFSEVLDGNASLGWAVDLGFLYHAPLPGLQLAACIQNLGPATRVSEDYFRLPLNFKAGVSYRLLPNLLAALDYNQLLEQEGKISLGFEYLYAALLALRAGYRYQGAIDNSQYYEGYGNNTLSGVSAGVGLRYAHFCLDYAFVPYGFLGSTHRLALTYAFAQPAAVGATGTALAATAMQTAKAKPVSLADQLHRDLEDIFSRIAAAQLPSIQFSPGMATLNEASFKTLDEIGAVLKTYPDQMVRIEGHTDDMGPAADNLRLSQVRVDAVKAYLVEKHSLKPGRLQAVGYGQSKPMAGNDTRAGRALNRRVEFIVVK